MASRAKSPRADEDALDPVEAADVEHADDPDEGLLELEIDEDEEPEDPDDLDADGLEADDLEADDLDDGSDEDAATPALDDADGDEDDASGAVVVLPDAAFDDDEDDVVAVVVDDDEDDDEIEGVRDGEFVCRRCYMAKRETQLADAERLLCRDCA